MTVNLTELPRVVAFLQAATSMSALVPVSDEAYRAWVQQQAAEVLARLDS